MKKSVAIIFISFFVSTAIAQECQINVQIIGVKKIEGNLIIALFDNEDDYLEKPVKSLTIETKEENNLACINGLSPGIYSVSVIHDLDKNGKLNTRLYGPPSEPYGFYNNVKGFMGPPSFDDTSFEIKKGEKIIAEIKLFE